VAPIEFTMARTDYEALGGHMDEVRRLEDVAALDGRRRVSALPGNPWPLERGG
jgi:hypothetical protein